MEGIIATAVLVALLAAGVFFAARAARRQRRKGCCGNCAACSACKRR